MASDPDQAEGLMIINGTSVAHDSNFETFIDSNQMLESTTSSAPPTPKGKAYFREAQKHKLAPLSALPSRLHDAKQISAQDLPHSPTVSDYLHFPRDASSSSEVTTPTTASNSSSLHNLNFDFYEGDHSTSHGHNAGPDASNLNSNTDGGHISAFGESMHTTPTGEIATSVPSASIFTWSASNAFFPIPMTHSLTRSSDEADSGLASRHLSQNHQDNHSHQRSLSLREVAPPSASDGLFASSMTSLPFPSVKLEAQEADLSGAYTSENMPSPITEDRSSPASSSAICSSLFEMASPRQEKKRRLTSPSESITSTTSSRNVKYSHNNATGNARKPSGVSTRKRKSSTSNSKGSANASNNNSTSAINSSKSYVKTEQENLLQRDLSGEEGPSSAASSLEAGKGDTNEEVVQSMSRDNSKEMCKLQESSSKSIVAEQSASVPARPSNKRPPPSASQITESGQPFPVIDTSAKHSSLFVPPDTSGLTKREARLVKNRAAAFLSRQRKREQFEELEIKCKSLCRLVWRFWEIVAGPNDDVSFAEKFSQTKILPIVLENELEDVKDVLEMVVALKGGSVAPTEDGQVQGAIAAGIKSANGKIIGSALTTAATKTTASAASSSVPYTSDSAEIARLKSELEESKKREASLQAELSKEKSLRLGEYQHDRKYHEERGIRPFKGGKAGGAISLTIPPIFEEDKEDEGDHYPITSKKKLSRSRITPARTSERILRQQSSNLALTNNSNAINGGQRKAAGAALMMVLFSFALFGLPSGQTSRVGGITQVGSAEDFSISKVLGAPLSTAQYSADDEDENGDFDVKQTPSSHLSVKDLLPSNSESSDLLNFDDIHATISTPRLERMQHTFQEVLRSGKKDQDGLQGDDGIVDYRAFARDLGASLDWDVERGFLVIGSDHEHEIENGQADQMSRRNSKSEGSNDDGNEEKSTTGEAPTKLTLFVPAPDVTSDLEGAEDRFYDAPLATADVTAGGSDAQENGGEGESNRKGGSVTSKDLTQAEATRAALRVLRNHRIAQEAAALATSRKLSKKVNPPRSIATSTISTLDSRQHLFVSPAKSGTLIAEEEEDMKMMDIEGEEDYQEEDYSREVMNAGDGSSTTDKIRGTDFYQLEFSLSGAKVRNVAELAKLFGVVRSKREPNLA